MTGDFSFLGGDDNFDDYEGWGENNWNKNNNKLYCPQKTAPHRTKRKMTSIRNALFVNRENEENCILKPFPYCILFLEVTG